MTQVTDESTTDGVTDQVAEKLHDAALAVQEKATALRDDGSARLRRQLEQRASQTGTQLRLVAEALRRGGSELDAQGGGGAAHLTSQAAQRIDSLGTYLEQKSGDQLVADVESFTRQRPWLLAGVGMVAGVAAARLLKASSAGRYGELRRTSGQAESAPGASRPAPRVVRGSGGIESGALRSGSLA